MGSRVVKIEPYKNSDGFSGLLIHVKKRLFWFKPKLVTYFGDCTVWHHFPSGRRASATTEYWLADVWQGWKFKQMAPDPALTPSPMEREK